MKKLTVVLAICFGIFFFMPGKAQTVLRWTLENGISRIHTVSQKQSQWCFHACCEAIWGIPQCMSASNYYDLLRAASPQTFPDAVDCCNPSDPYYQMGNVPVRENWLMTLVQKNGGYFTTKVPLGFLLPSQFGTSPIILLLDFLRHAVVPIDIYYANNSGFYSVYAMDPGYGYFKWIDTISAANSIGCSILK